MMTAVSRSAFRSSLISRNHPLSANRGNNTTRHSCEQENAIAEIFERVSSRVIERVDTSREEGSRHEHDTLMRLHIKAALEEEFKKNVSRDLWARLSNLESRLNGRDAEITKLRAENAELIARHAEKERFADRTYERDTRMISMLNEKRENLNNRLAELEARIEKLLVRNQEKGAKIAELSVQPAQPSVKKKRLVVGNRDRNAAINKLSREREELNHRIAGIAELVAEVERSVAEKEKIKASLAWQSAEIAELNREREELNNRIAGLEAEAARSIAEKEKIKASLAWQIDEIATLSDRIAKLNTEIDEQSIEKQKLIAENQSRNNRIAELSDRIAGLNREKEELDSWDIVSKPDSDDAAGS